MQKYKLINKNETADKGDNFINSINCFTCFAFF